jgi:hypothetical protein
MNACSLAVSIGPWTARAGWLDDALRPLEVVFPQNGMASHTSQCRRTADALAELGRVAHVGGWPLNPLGVVKFQFDSPYSVIIHDTPKPGRFNSLARFYSSGCVCIEDPDALADFLLQNADEDG